MTKKNKLLIVLIAIFAVLCGIYFGISKYSEKALEESESAEEAETITMSRMKNITQIALNSTNGEIGFIYHDDTWFYQADETFPLNTSMVNLIQTDLSELTAEKKLEQPDDLASYGLEQPAYTVTAADAEGNSQTILIGNLTSSDQEYYAMIQGETVVYTISGDFITAIDYKLNQFIAMDELPELSEDNINTVTAVTPTATVSYQKQEIEENSQSETPAEETGEQTESEATEQETEAEISWNKLKDGTAEAVEDSSSIHSALGTLQTLSPVECVSYQGGAETLAAYGLDEASRTTVLIDYEDDNQEKTIMLQIGAKDETGTYYYTAIDNSNKVQTISASYIDSLLSAFSAE